MSHTRPVQGHPEWEVRTLGAHAYIYHEGEFQGAAGDIYAAAELARKWAAEAGDGDA